jgi:hypothetical protein
LDSPNKKSGAEADDSESESEPPRNGKSGAPATPITSEYAVAREINRARTMELANQIDAKFRMKYPGLLPEASPKVVGKKRPRKKNDHDVAQLQHSTRINQER